MGGIAVAVMGEVSISPFGTPFRFSLGPIMFDVLILFFPMLRPLPIAFTAGVVIVGFRIATGIAATSWANWLLALIGPISDFGPEIIAYSVLGAVAGLGQVQGRLNRPVSVAAVLAVGDFSANLVELLVRRFQFDPRAVFMTALIAVGRAAVSTGLFEVARASEKERRWAEERRSYAQRLLFLSSLQTDTFFLRKSAREIEAIMERAHRLYRDLRGHRTQPEALGIARDIHEVKKDYQRTLASLSRLLEMPDLEPVMRFSEIAMLVVDANSAYAGNLGKQIEFVTELSADFATQRYGRWVSILNNLVTNGIEACPEQGSISIRSAREGDLLRVEVADTGSGIPEKDQAHLFSAGFSTKLNPETGSFSSGLGLTHVAELVKAMHGEILLVNSGAVGTTFRIEVPWSALEVAEEE